MKMVVLTRPCGKSVAVNPMAVMFVTDYEQNIIENAVTEIHFESGRAIVREDMGTVISALNNGMKDK